MKSEKTNKQQKNFGASAGGLGKRIFSREALLLRGRRKGDPDTKSGLGTKNGLGIILFFAIFSLLSARSAEKIFTFVSIQWKKVCVPKIGFPKCLNFQLTMFL